MKKSCALTAALLSLTMILSGCLGGYESSSASSDNSVSNTATESETEITTISEETTVSFEETTTEAGITEATTTEATTTEATTTAEETTTKKNDSNFSDKLVVHYIDVGQGDSIFIELPNGEAMLIDAGEKDYGDKVVTYIHSKGYDTLDYVVATHAHSDHIGGMANVVDNFNVKNFYMTSASATTQAYSNMLNAVKKSGASVHNAMAGETILNDRNLSVEIVAPKEIDNDNQNNNSVVIKLTYGDNKFVFAGDAEKSEEDGIWTNIKCDVLKIGHHGSDSSSTANFLKKTEAKYAVISCGLNNSYGHPTDSVLKRLNDRNIAVYRTDLQGTIVFTSNGKDISVNVKPSENNQPVVTTAVTTTVVTTTTTAPVTTVATITTTAPLKTGGTIYVLNTNTKKIHYKDCSSVKQMKDSNKSYTDDYNGAIAQGYKPCQKCNPR